MRGVGQQLWLAAKVLLHFVISLGKRIAAAVAIGLFRPRQGSTQEAGQRVTGLRPGEVLGLLVETLDFEHCLIHVGQTVYSKLQTPKSRSGFAPVLMPAPLEAMLRDYLAG